MNSENTLVTKQIQNGLKKLISEEFYAYQLYTYSRMAVKKEDHEVLNALFEKIGSDELNDHLKELTSWCRQCDCDIPCSDREFKKYASNKIFKQVQQLKKNKDAAYYISEAIKSEQDAIDSYKKIIDIDEISQFTDLQSLLWHIYYDETEHLNELNSLKIAYEANVNMVI